jgi:hypothetical protein
LNTGEEKKEVRMWVKEGKGKKKEEARGGWELRERGISRAFSFLDLGWSEAARCERYRLVHNTTCEKGDVKSRFFFFSFVIQAELAAEEFQHSVLETQ